jgi:hypothetical protein
MNRWIVLREWCLGSSAGASYSHVMLTGGSDFLVGLFSPTTGENLWLHIIGTTGQDTLTALVMTETTVFAGGHTSTALAWPEAAAAQPALGYGEGVVVAFDVADGSVQFITHFGTVSNNDFVSALTVSPDQETLYVTGQVEGDLDTGVECPGAGKCLAGKEAEWWWAVLFRFVVVML